MIGSMRTSEDRRRGCMIDKLTLTGRSQILVQHVRMMSVHVRRHTDECHPCYGLFLLAVEASLFGSG